MRIGILTYHCVTNFGAQLQTLSTIGYLKKNGHEPVVLNWFPQDLENFYLNQHPKAQFDEQFGFSMSVMPVTKLCRTLDQLYKVIDESRLDSIFCGSDALFDYTPQRVRQSLKIGKYRYRPIEVTSNQDLPNPFWGSFNDHIKRKLPYGGFSISSQNMPYNKLTVTERKELGRLLNGFSALTLRDDWTKQMVESVSGRHDVFVTPDPVFAFNNNTSFRVDKTELIKKYNLPDNYYLISFGHKVVPAKLINGVINQIESKTGVKCVSLPMPRGLKRFDTEYAINLPLPTLDWYYLIKYSQGYIGELMHPIIVCLHNSVPFYSFDQYGVRERIIPRLWYRFIPESSKIYDILQRADLLSNWCPFIDASKRNPEEVVDSVIKFDKEKCSLFADNQYQKYASGMETLLDSLKK